KHLFSVEPFVVEIGKGSERQLMGQLNGRRLFTFPKRDARTKILKTLNKIGAQQTKREFRPKEGPWQVHARDRSAAEKSGRKIAGVFHGRRLLPILRGRALGHSQGARALWEMGGRGGGQERRPRRKVP